MNKTVFRCALATMAPFWAAFAVAQTPQPSETLSQVLLPFNSMRLGLIQALQSAPKSVVINGQRVALLHPERVAAFYKSEQYPMVWTQEQRFTGQLPVLQGLLKNAREDALNPARYHYGIIKNLRENQDYPDIVAYELLLSDAYLSLLGDLTNGLVNPKVTQKTWNVAAVPDKKMNHDFAQGIIAGDLGAPLESANAQNSRYQHLKARYDQLLQAPATAANRAALDNLKINMERLRWMPQHWGDAYVIVNIPAFEVTMSRDGRQVYQTRAVVGRPDRPTPTFSDEVRNIVMSPTWTVPPTIMQKDKLPRLKRNAAAYDATFEAVGPGGHVVAPSSVDWSTGTHGYVLRQKPGPRNALGRIKFLFPNVHSVYMHDTPSKSLFARSKRAYSSGCVRLQKPMEFAGILLDGTRWTPQSIQRATHDSREHWVSLSAPLPIYLVYWTGWVDERGSYHRSGDVYGLDRRLLSQYNSANREAL